MVKLVERHAAADLAHLDARLVASAGIEDAGDHVIAFLRFYEDGADELMAEQTGCLFATMLAEREFTGSEINRLVAATQETWRREVGDLLRGARADVPNEIDIDALADHLFTTFEGRFILCRTFEDGARSATGSRIPAARRSAVATRTSPTLGGRGRRPDPRGTRRSSPAAPHAPIRSRPHG